ncbi:MAG: ABC transporter ATP-binding protein [Gammaproteobacteria bacterium]|nr:ABC transporter ATP-binding protein [Gammaproteobacteria bacterium]MXW46814.1 ABC transporter ATP-binding protein [Gammaproteobacteria bacterium]MYD03214.1 ABC transporter ATP-binding protein [Gammaproteobacteria bacterium]MYI24250.1 ABC transporter ATP-binding protein [Gammaproteobacteria bacterium]
MARELIRLAEVSKNYRKGRELVRVLEGISLAIEEGDFVGLMGPSGSGKTTLLNLLGGLDKPTSGDVEVDGRNISNLSTGALAKWRASNIGFIFQFYNLLPVLTAARNVGLPLLLTSLSASQRKKHVNTALQLVGLADRAKHYPRELSGGQEQRVAIARAIVSDPPILLCDEPTGDLDRATADEIMSLLQRLNRDYGKTIVMVTHDPRAASFAHRVLHLDKGELGAAPEEIH